LAITLAALALASSAQSSSPPQEPPPPGEIRVTAQDQGRQLQLHDGQVLMISLEANPSTGYGWEMDKGPLAAQSDPILVQIGDEFEPGPQARSPTALAEEATPPLLGAPQNQVLRFQAAREGKTPLRLAYRRPWEANIAPLGEFSLTVEAVGPFTQPAPARMSKTSSGPELPLDLGDAGQLGLPPSFNWCDQGACTPVRDQGSCGSCWAFSTVAPLESNILHYDEAERDLSEQYLLSCNFDGWDCGGGWFAHDYHQWKIPYGEPAAGAVYEGDFPYVAQDYPCNPPHDHYEQIADWEYVGNSSSVPSVGAIKQAIFEQGPVSVAICISDNFRSYGGGVFETEGCGTLDHAVVLVGWDDTQGDNGIWYLRNSWGTGWGEDGYMRIAYGVSAVGYAANYVVYYPACYDLDLLVSPQGAGTIVTEPPANCQGGGYEPDALVELTANASPGWHFSSWGGDASGSSNPFVLTMDSDKSVTAHFICDGCLRRSNLPLGVKNWEYQPTGWVTMLEEDFEGSFPSSWEVLDNVSGFGQYYWGKRDCAAFEGNHAGWAVGAGAHGSQLSCGSSYPNYAESWMVSGPFSLVGATAADLQFEQRLDTEVGHDRMCRLASTDGMYFYGSCSSGHSGGWVHALLDLSNVYSIGNLLGEPQVWVGLVFQSDESVNYAEGAYVDAISLRKYLPPAGRSPAPLEGASCATCGTQLTEEQVSLARER
jgi:predicted secreted protein